MTDASQKAWKDSRPSLGGDDMQTVQLGRFEIAMSRKSGTTWLAMDRPLHFIAVGETDAAQKEYAVRYVHQGLYELLREFEEEAVKLGVKL